MRSSPLNLFAIVLLPMFLLALPLVICAQSGWTPELEMKVRGIGAVRVSPDGKKVVYTVKRAKDGSENKTNQS
jgi:hypothetical protein